MLCFKKGTTPPSDMLTIAELLIDNGARMDFVDVYSDEASRHLQNFSNGL